MSRNKIETEVDWDEVRRAKMRCRIECRNYNDLLQECSFNLVASKSCEKFKRRREILCEEETKPWWLNKQEKMY